MPDSPTPRRSAVHYDVTQRPPVEVLHGDGCWYAGRLHAWVRTARGWRAVVSYEASTGLQHYLDVSPDEVRRLPDPGQQAER